MELSDDALRSIVAHLAHMRAAYGEVLADAELVEPNGEFFPDEFALEPAAIHRLARRMMTYAPLSADLDVELAFAEAEQAAKGGCGSGACGPGGGGAGARVLGGALETNDGYGVVVATSDVGEPKLLTASLARAVGRLVLFEADEQVDPRDEGPIAELTAVACGFGVILLGGACVYKKGCGGMRMHQGTFLSVHELALATALFVRASDKKPGAVRRHLDVTQREAFDAALDWVDGHPSLLAAFVDDPESLQDGVFVLEEKKGFLSRLLARKPPARDDVPEAIPVRAKERTEEERRRIAEARALVEEALNEP
ncbi:MAG: hypothetical protein KF819_38740 [Labilithrix sp.]|nr:hypothetical protein [Labilithrix sp.]